MALRNNRPDVLHRPFVVCKGLRNRSRDLKTIVADGNLDSKSSQVYCASSFSNWIEIINSDREYFIMCMSAWRSLRWTKPAKGTTFPAGTSSISSYSPITVLVPSGHNWPSGSHLNFKAPWLWLFAVDVRLLHIYSYIGVGYNFHHTIYNFIFSFRWKVYLKIKSWSKWNKEKHQNHNKINESRTKTKQFQGLNSFIQFFLYIYFNSLIKKRSLCGTQRSQSKPNAA